jgi:hypothetical protein
LYYGDIILSPGSKEPWTILQCKKCLKIPKGLSEDTKGVIRSCKSKIPQM